MNLQRNTQLSKEKRKKTERKTESFELEIKTKRTEQNGVEQRAMVCRFVVVVFHLDAIKMNMNAQH